MTHKELLLRFFYFIMDIVANVSIISKWIALSLVVKFKSHSVSAASLLQSVRVCSEQCSYIDKWLFVDSTTRSSRLFWRAPSLERSVRYCSSLWIWWRPDCRTLARMLLRRLSSKCSGILFETDVCGGRGWWWYLPLYVVFIVKTSGYYTLNKNP